MDSYKYFRCQNCGLLTTDAMNKAGFCVGHRLKIAQRGKIWEWMFIKLGIYEWLMLKFGDIGE